MSVVVRFRRPWELPSGEITDEALYLRRRDFLKRGAAATGMLAGITWLPGCSAAEDASSPAGKDTASTAVYGDLPKGVFGTEEELTDFQDASSYNNYYEFGSEKADPVQYAGGMLTRPWSVSIEGMLKKPGSIPLEDLLKPHALEERTYRLRCVEAWSMVIPWVGIPLAEVLKRLEPAPEARFVEFRTLSDPEQMPALSRKVLDWPYREGLRIDEAMNPLAFLAVGMFGRELPNQNGAPLRLVVPWKYGFKSIKSIVSIKLMETQPQTSWNVSSPKEYGFYSNVNPEVDHPRWSQKRERRIGEFRKRKTLPFNGYGEQVAHLYSGMNLSRFY
ncbi:MAG: protein-methionine-sulfoxide reductase catalytic subunit MsrP [bacterium]|nr:protein-methionine-sulfoxide reductase catalytic subunit MsrP [bacterium]